MDLQSLLGLSSGNDPAGLLTPQQSGDINQTTMQGIAAGLLKASGPSPYKPGMTALSGLGDALQGGLAARRQAQSDALSQTLVRAKTLEGVAPLFKLQQEYAQAGIPLPENYKRVIDSLSGIVTGRPGAPGASVGAVAVSPQMNAIHQAADKLGISRYDLLPSSGAHDAAMKRIGDYLSNVAPDRMQSERDKAIMTSDVARSEKAYPALVGLGHAAYQAKQDTELSQALVNEPGFKSGFGSGLSELAKKFVVSIGGDPNAAFPMEAFNKITASNINTQIGEMKGTAAEMGGAAGRVFQSQINLMEKASQNLQNTPAANRFLANLQARAADVNIAISDMAIQYKKEHGILDAGFDEKMSKYLRDNPLYSKEELANLPKIATPAATPGTPAPAPAGPLLGGGRPTPAPVPGQPPQAGAAGGAPPGVEIHVNKKTGQRGYIDPQTGQWTLING
jgi:hypothetical protein